jgi:hypothetical protein
MPLSKSRRKDQLKDPDLERWYRNVARGAEVTADVYIRRLGAFCEQMGVKPTEIIELPEPKLRDLLLDFVTAEEKKGHAGSYVRSSLKAVKSWLAHNGKGLTVPVRVRGGDATPTLRDEQVPTPQDVHKVLLTARLPRDRVAVLLMAHGGFRPEVLGNYGGKDGLRLGDFPDLIIEGKRAWFGQMPAVVRVRPELSKNTHGYLSWASTELCQYIEAYLNERLARGERLDSDSDLVHPEKEKKRFLTAINVGDVIRGSIRRAGFSWRPYVLRAYFDTQMLLAESRGKIPHDYRVFWMGHKGTIDARYTTNKGRLPKDLIDDQRAAYGRAEELLSTEASKSDRATVLEGVLAALLKEKGVKDDKVAEILKGGVERDELERLLGSRGPKQQLIAESDLPSYLAEGWVARMPVSGSQFVVERP